MVILTSHSAHSWRFYSAASLFVVVCVIATVFQLYLEGDEMYEMRRKPEPTLLPMNKGIFNLPHHIGMI